MRSAPQKQPSPSTIDSVSSGKGGAIGVPSTAWSPGWTIGVSRPGRASSGAGIVVLWRLKSMVLRLAAAT